MSLRGRIAVTAAAAVAVAVALVAVGVYGATARQLRTQVDAELAEVARTVARIGATDTSPRDRLRAFEEVRRRGAPDDGAVGDARREPSRFVGPAGVGSVQQVRPDGTTRAVGPFALPVDEGTLALARDGGTPLRSTVDVGDTPVRVLAVAAGDAGAIQVALPITDVDRALTALRRQLLLAGLLGAALAALLGAVVADRAVRPVRRLTVAAEEVGRTQDLRTRIDDPGDDELGRLAGSFNAMLASLERARESQRQLVADASHELRTPLTSLRTNIEVLRLDRELEPEDRRSLLRDVDAQLGEFGRLVDALVELARGDRPARAPTPVALGSAVEEVVDRSTVFHPQVPITLDADGSVVVAERDRLDRAVANLVDNAVKHGGGAPVEVTVRDGAVVVRDHGPGIDAADLPHVFDRFYRAPSARARPGSGLGLSIVAQVAETHGGEVAAANHPDGGAVLTLSLPSA